MNITYKSTFIFLTVLCASYFEYSLAFKRSASLGLPREFRLNAIELVHFFKVGLEATINKAK